MRITAEISLYPLREEFLSPIQSFIRDLQESSALEITVNQMSTQLVGELHDVSQALEKALELAVASDGEDDRSLNFGGGPRRQHDQRPRRRLTTGDAIYIYICYGVHNIHTYLWRSVSPVQAL